MNGKIWIDHFSPIYYPKVDGGICSSRIVHIERGCVSDAQKAELGPIGTKLVENLLRIPGVREMFVQFDQVFLPVCSTNQTVSRTQVAKAICSALGWEEASLYDLSCDNWLGTVRVEKPLNVKASSVAGKPGFREFKPVNSRFDGFPDRTANFDKPLVEKDLYPLGYKTGQFVRAIMAVPGVRMLSVGPEHVTIFLRAGYGWHEVDSGVRSAFEKTFPGVWFS